MTNIVRDKIEEAMKYKLSKGQDSNEYIDEVDSIFLIIQENVQDINNIIRFLDKLDNDVSNYITGMMYLLAISVEKNIKLALEYLKDSACEDNIKAQQQIGLIYYNGDHIPKNIGESIRWFRLAANQGDKVSIDLLRKIYETENQADPLHIYKHRIDDDLLLELCIIEYKYGGSKELFKETLTNFIKKKDNILINWLIKKQDYEKELKKLKDVTDNTCKSCKKRKIEEIN